MDQRTFLTLRVYTIDPGVTGLWEFSGHTGARLVAISGLGRILACTISEVPWPEGVAVVHTGLGGGLLTEGP